jgi:hypothetical protein
MLIRYSDREVNIRSIAEKVSEMRTYGKFEVGNADIQGSSAPFTIRSSIITPRKPSARDSKSGGRPWADKPAFIPATTPWAAASSYPVVPNERMMRLEHR